MSENDCIRMFFVGAGPLHSSRAGQRLPPSRDRPGRQPGQGTREGQTPTPPSSLRSRYSIPLLPSPRYSILNTQRQNKTSLEASPALCTTRVISRALPLSAARLPFPPALRNTSARPLSSPHSTASKHPGPHACHSTQAAGRRNEPPYPFPGFESRSHVEPASSAAAACWIPQHHGRGRPAQSARHQCVLTPLPIPRPPRQPRMGR
jgi:hypothetical protein